MSNFESIGDTALNSDSEFQYNVSQAPHKNADEKSPTNNQNNTPTYDSQDKTQSKDEDLNLTRIGVTLKGYEEYIQYTKTHLLPNYFVDVNVINDDEEMQLKYTRINSDGTYGYYFIRNELKIMVYGLPQLESDVPAYGIEIPDDLDDLRRTYCWGSETWCVNLQGIIYKYYSDDTSGFGRLTEFSFYVDDRQYIWRFPRGIPGNAFFGENTFISKMLDTKTALEAYSEFAAMVRSEVR
jgi:hypothetical protein